MRVLLRLCVLVWLASGPGPAAAGVARPETVADTLDLLRGAFLAKASVTRADIDRQDMSLSYAIDANGPFRVFPDNLHTLLREAGTDAQRQQILDDFTLALLDPEAERRPLDPSLILPVIRTANFDRTAGPDEAIVSAPFAGDLRVFYVFNYPRTISYVSQAQMTAMGLDAARLRELAFGNFAAQGWQPRIEGEGLFLLAFDGTFEATFLLDPTLWDVLDVQVGRLLMVPLARDLVVFADGDWDGMETALKGLGPDMRDRLPYPLSETLFEWRAGAWHALP